MQGLSEGILVSHDCIPAASIKRRAAIMEVSPFSVSPSLSLSSGWEFPESAGGGFGFGSAGPSHGMMVGSSTPLNAQLACPMISPVLVDGFDVDVALLTKVVEKAGISHGKQVEAVFAELLD